MSIWMILRISASAIPHPSPPRYDGGGKESDRRQPLQKVGAHIVDMALHRRARRLAVATGQRVDDRQMLVAHLVEAFGQAAETEPGGALPKIGDGARQHRIARGLGDGDVEIAIVPA